MAMNAIIETMTANEIFVPTLINVPPDNAEAIGPAVLDLTCKAFAAGQVLMMLGGYIVKGTLLGCRKLARAIRNADGTFEMVRPGQYNFTNAFALPPPPQPALPQSIQVADDIAAAASSVLLAIQNTPSPTGNLLPKLEAQAEVETSNSLSMSASSCSSRSSRR